VATGCRVRVALGALGVGIGALLFGAGPSPLLISNAVSGAVQQHVVTRSDTLRGLAAFYGVDDRLIAAENGLAPGKSLVAGVTLTIDNRHIAPALVSADPGGVVINVPQRMLFRLGESLAAYPVAVGQPDWRTPLGVFHVEMKEEHPTWDVPVSIQEEMRQSGKRVITRMPPGPNNPLGHFWIGLSASSVGVHGTPYPTTLYRYSTHGCIRVHPDNIARLFPAVAVGDPVRIVYERVLMADTPRGLFIEAHGDPYGRAPGDRLEEVRAAAIDAGIDALIEWDTVADALQRREGVARLVGRR
jgi:L,D-transpeptidase ErfK/SrfK